MRFLKVVLVDWSGGNDHPYSKAVGNTQIVGLDVANLILNIMTEKKSVKPHDFHLIGYSLGAHVAGIAGLKVKGIGRITGLDPTSFFYTGKSEVFKLDSSDADFVDVIHTDGSKKVGMGTRNGTCGFLSEWRQRSTGLQAGQCEILYFCIHLVIKSNRRIFYENYLCLKSN